MNEYKVVYKEAIALLKNNRKIEWLNQFNTEFLIGFRIYLININSRKTKMMRIEIINIISEIIKLREDETSKSKSGLIYLEEYKKNKMKKNKILS